LRGFDIPQFQPIVIDGQIVFVSQVEIVMRHRLSFPPSNGESYSI
jgi:hypothetical protein